MEGLSNFSRSYKEYPIWRSTNSSFDVMRVINDVSTMGERKCRGGFQKKKRTSNHRSWPNGGRAKLDRGQHIHYQTGVFLRRLCSRRLARLANGRSR